jgi:hypothetical protein
MQDNRIRFPSTEVDFEGEVGLTGQTHDIFPSPGQARYDWMRMYLIGLLSCQSSEQQPINYREGTIWYHLDPSGSSYKYFNGDVFADIADAIEGQGTNLTSWTDEVQEKLERVSPRAVFSGVSETNYLTEIDIPDDVLFVAAHKYVHPIMFRNGKLIDPRLTKFNNGRTKITLISSETIGDARLLLGDEYTVIIERVDFIEPNSVIAS